MTLGARLVNDEAPECRKQVANCVTALLTLLEPKDRDSLFDVGVLWLKDKKISHRRLAAQLLGFFVSVEKTAFEGRLPKLLPLILKQFALNDEEKDEESERVKDHLFFQLLQMLLKICTHCTSFFKIKEVDALNRQVQALLSYPHEWVRLAAAQYLGFVFAATDVDALGVALTYYNPALLRAT